MLAIVEAATEPGPLGCFGAPSAWPTAVRCPRCPCLEQRIGRRRPPGRWRAWRRGSRCWARHSSTAYFHSCCWAIRRKKIYQQKAHRNSWNTSHQQAALFEPERLRYYQLPFLLAAPTKMYMRSLDHGSPQLLSICRHGSDTRAQNRMSVLNMALPTIQHPSGPRSQIWRN